VVPRKKKISSNAISKGRKPIFIKTMEEQMKGPMGGPRPEECRGGMCQGKMCGMGGCCSGHGCWRRAIRLVLGIAIIVIVFCFGVMVGELKGALIRETSGYRMMGGYGRVYPMMQDGYGSALIEQGQTVSAAPAK
jgi:hypothetical protein